jgi:riboflavin kinase / FMN adenylyltransferase
MRVCAVEEGNPSGAIVVAGLGTFDGVHRAHRAMLAELKRVATDKDAEVGLLVVEGGAHYRARMLTSLEHRLELLRDSGEVDTVWVIPSDVHERPRDLLGAALDAVHPVALGVSGLMRLGRVDLLSLEELETICAEREIEMFSMDMGNPGRHEAAEVLYTTRNISGLLFEGHVALAGRMLGRLFEMRGTVEHGDHRGRTLGVPTVNLSVHSSYLIPKEGVYAGVVITDDGVAHTAAISLGRRATFYEDGWELLEAHLLDFDGDLYGTSVRVLFTEYIRNQHRFGSVDELVAQLRIDIGFVRELEPLDRYRASVNW